MDELEPYIDPTLYEWQWQFDNYLSTICKCTDDGYRCCEIETLRDFINNFYDGFET